MTAISTSKAGRTKPQGSAETSLSSDEAIAKVQIRPARWDTVEIPLRGTSPYIAHKFSQKAIRQIEEKQQKALRAPKQARDPKAEFEDSMYRLNDGRGYGIPANAFKCAMVGACRYQDSMKMTEARGTFFVRGEWSDDAGREVVPIDGSKPKMRRDMVRLSGPGRTADVRYRGEFMGWRCTLRIQYNAEMISPTHLVYLLQHAGMGVGVGEMRPEQNGDVFGCFEPDLPVASKSAKKKAA